MAKKKLSLNGKVVAHNISPKGQVEGLMVETKDGLVQINLPKDGGTVVEVGKRASFEAEPHEREGVHSVYLSSDPAGDVEGRVVRFNYSRHGEVNGYHLDDRTFIHVKPDGARRAKVDIGDRIRASGTRKRGEHATVIDTDTVARTTHRE